MGAAVGRVYLFVLLRHWPDENDLHFWRRDVAARREMAVRRHPIPWLILLNTVVLLLDLFLVA